MNKKIIALAMIPLLIGLSGAMAFSQFTGSDQKVIAAGAGTVEFAESGQISAAYLVNNSIMSIQGPNGSALSGAAIAGGAALGNVSSHGASASYMVSVSNMNAGEWVEITFTITNMGTLPLVVSLANQTNVTAAKQSGIQAEQVTGAPASVFTANGAMGSTWLYANDATALSSAAGVSLSTSGHEGAGGAYSFDVWVGLGDAAVSYAGSHFTYTLNINISSE